MHFYVFSVVFKWFAILLTFKANITARQML